MKRLLILSTFMIVSLASRAQIQYTVNKVAYGSSSSSGELSAGQFKQLSKRFIAYVYKDAMVFDEGFDGLGDTYYRFVRQIDTGDPNKQRWNALDIGGNACEITIKDYNTYSLIAVKYMNSSKVTFYQTL